jgi:hypothetical protein
METWGCFVILCLLVARKGLVLYPFNNCRRGGKPRCVTRESGWVQLALLLVSALAFGRVPLAAIGRAIKLSVT